jgi:DEAD/DEAH box helicase domain-containing protein
MYPSLISQDIEHALKEFIVTGYETDTPHFAGKFRALMYDDVHGEAFVKGPYVSMGLPFYKKPNANQDFFKSFKTEHSPFAHQETAWQRLAAEKPLPTLVATGTGSGKTECFLYPLLNHCLQDNSQGIKAIIIYPMNALATDQAKRFAEIIHSIPELKGQVNVGLFVGGSEATDQKMMQAEQVITCKETLRKNPPDILLTNYKMLDYLLMRPKDQVLWRFNQPETLRYLVVDELHTFDGAQGSDLAMLIRRLKAHLSTPKNYLTPIGTSATIGSEEEKPKLIEFISKIFDAEFDGQSIIGETRVSPTNFLKPIEYFNFWFDFNTEWLNPDFFDSEAEYLKHQAWLFFGPEADSDEGFDLQDSTMDSRVALGEKLKSHAFFMKLLQTSQTLVHINKLVPDAKQLPPNFRPFAKEILASLLALVAYARGDDYPGQPFVSLRFQVWVRELKRIVASVHPDPEKVQLHFSDDLKKTPEKMVLPVLQCSECHSTAWLAAEQTGENKIETELRPLYSHFFNNDAKFKVLLPLEKEAPAPLTPGAVQYLCSDCGHLSLTEMKSCHSCGNDEIVRVFDAGQVKQSKEKGVNKNKKDRACPVCQANNSLILFGSQAASLTSVAINQLFSNHFNHDKKLIAFSDSVQDAAHRAGFYSARTWEMNLRIAMTQYLQAHQMIPYLTFLDHWFDPFVLSESNPKGWDEAKFISQFIAPNLESEDIYIRLKKGLNPELSSLLSYVKQRLSWEALQEVGIRSNIGRSLSRTGVAQITWSPNLIRDASEQLLLQAQEKLGQPLSRETAEHLLWGIALQMRRRGAIFHQLLSNFVKHGGDYFLLTKIPFLPQFGKHSILPKYPALQAEKGYEVIQPKQGSSWYFNWLRVNVPVESLVGNHFYEDLLQLCMDALIDSGLVNATYSQKGNKVWGLNSDKLMLTTLLTEFELTASNDSQIQARQYFPADWKESISGLPDLDLKRLASGHHAIWKISSSKRDESFYKTFYQTGEVNRVIGHEHTGLLTRGLRESVENRFKAKEKERKPWYENLLSATPTLEMGIDIGDLSSVVLASVPPNQASYLQRIGRAGRSTGNSIALTVANGQPHDLYFYANPENMMAGAVEPPAIFLEASMVLRRQLLGFCFDDWGRISGGKQVIPSSMQAVINAVKEQKLTQFPYTLIEFIKTHRDRLWDEFSEILPHSLDQQAKERLKAIIVNPKEEEQQIEWRLMNRLKELVDEVERLEKQKKQLENTLKKAEARPKDEATENEIRELEEEISGVSRLRYQIMKRETLNFLTDEGLLPNYAFPEEGTTLKSVIFRRSSDPSGQSPYESETYEYSRPAHAAISELAPNSIFYASNFKVTIDRIETAKGKSIEYMRICPSCSYSEKASEGLDHAVCPRCGSQGWAGMQQKFPVLRLTQVYARSSIKSAQLGDDKDTREPIFFNKQMLVDIDPEEVELAYAFEDEHKPFGFEFVRKANFLEINFGEQTGSQDRTFHIAGKELERPGFRVCRDCGTVQPKKGKAEHQHFCKYAKLEGNEGIEECLYLYRQYSSEAIRILMPRMSIAPEEEQINSFVAAMQLGLKKRFGGKVDHLQIMVSDQPIPDSDHREQYVVIYDSVPGGTGYLHELLADPNNLIETFKAAQKVMAECSCQHSVPEVDGCYKCLYAYRNSYGMENTSRKTALNMLHEILEGDEELKPVEHLGKVKKVIWEDSLLEQKFPEALKALHRKPAINGEDVKLKLDLLKGKKAYQFSIGEQSYRIEMHVQVGPNDGVAYHCEPDFVIYPVKTTHNMKPIAIFLDGYEYHYNIVHQDLLKRQALILSGQYWVWSLSWYDIENAFAKSEVKATNYLNEIANPEFKPMLQKVSSQLGSYLLSDLKLSSFQLLAKLLVTSDVSGLEKLSALQVVSSLNPANQSPLANEAWQDFSENFPVSYMDEVAKISPMLAIVHSKIDEQSILTFGVLNSDQFIQNLDLSEAAIGIQVSLGPKESESSRNVWLKMWQLVNWLQFFPKFYAGEVTATQNAQFSELSWQRDGASYVHPDWEFVFEEITDDIEPVVHLLVQEGVSRPIVGYEYTGSRGDVLAEAELGWADSKVVVLIEEMAEEQDVFIEQGYQVFIYSGSNEAEIVQALKGRV